jgi:hypothetical protein
VIDPKDLGIIIFWRLFTLINFSEEVKIESTFLRLIVLSMFSLKLKDSKRNNKRLLREIVSLHILKRKSLKKLGPDTNL